jgi:hypothetical protein
VIRYEDLLGQPYAVWKCGQVAVEIARRAGKQIPDQALEEPEDLGRWLTVASPTRYTEGDVILGRDRGGMLFAGGLVCRRQGLVVTSSHREGVFALPLASINLVGVYRWPSH